jgi:hypothetical protein
MKPLFTVHAGEYLVGDYIERTYPKWCVWVPSNDTGTDLLVTAKGNRKAVSIQVKYSKDFNPSHASPLLQGRLLAGGWWTHDPKMIERSSADFWIFVLPSFVEKQVSFIILPPQLLLRRLRAIHSQRSRRIHSYLRVTKTKRCWEARGLGTTDQDLVALDRFSDSDRDFTQFLNAWKQLERKLR